MNLRTLLIICLAGTLASCMTSKPLVQKASVQKVEQGKEYNDFAVSYALPRTVVNVNVLAEKTITKPGPFAAYAEKYLGIVTVPTRETNEWKIKKLTLSTSGQRDPGQVYRVSSEGISRANRIQLNPEGVLLGVNLTPELAISPKLRDVYLNKTGDLVIPGYSTLTLRKNTEPMLDTTYQTFRTDTSFIRLPVLKEQISKKTIMNQAEEAANVIMTIRERRFHLLNGEISFELELIPLPDGPALDIMIRELNKLENEYVSLFVGKTMSEEKEYDFSYIPGNENNKESGDLFTFSSFNGVLPAGNSNGDPVRLVIDPVPGFQGQADKVILDNKDGVEKRTGLAYRIPGMANISVEKDGERLISEPFLLAQFGIIQFLPANLMSQPDVMIRLHPDLGNLEGIYQK